MAGIFRNGGAVVGAERRNRSFTATKVPASPGLVGICIGCKIGEGGGVELGVGGGDGLNRSSPYASSGLQAALTAVAKSYPGMATILQSSQLGPVAIFFGPVAGCSVKRSRSFNA